MAQGASALVEERGVRFGVRLFGVHVAGGLAGGASAAGLGWLLLIPIRTLTPGSVPVALAVVAALAAIAGDLSGSRLLRNWRQVPPIWLAKYQPMGAYARYGVVLGTGVMTYVPYFSGTLCLVAAALLLPFSAALLVGTAFGLARTLAVPALSLAALRLQGLSTRYGGGQRRLTIVSGVISFIGLLATVGFDWLGLDSDFFRFSA